MEPGGSLEQSDQSSSGPGSRTAPERFTLAGEEVLRKIAQYHLPFSHAWAVKIVQAIVAGGSTGPIHVEVVAGAFRFKFPQADFTLDDFSEAFFTLESPTHRSLRHLLIGLWPVAVKDRWEFKIVLPGQKECLLWDGEQLHRSESREAPDQVCITVTPAEDEDALARNAPTGDCGAEMLSALSARCYVCPLPLKVDGQRIDTLQTEPQYGWTSETYPLGLVFAEAPIPHLGLPPGTFSGTTGPINFGSGFASWSTDDWRKFAERRMRKLIPRETAEVPFLWTIPQSLVGTGEIRKWKSDPGPSTVFWVSDGVVVGQEPLTAGQAKCTVGCFVNAQDLETDSASFYLTDSTARIGRLQLVRTAVLNGLDALDREPIEHRAKSSKSDQSVIAGLVLSAAIGSFFLSVPLAAFLVLVGGFMLATAGSRQRMRVSLIFAGLDDLRLRLREELKANEAANQ